MIEPMDAPRKPIPWAPLIAAIFCTAMIVEAILTLMGGLANGDLMVMVCPLLGAIFLSVPATQAWWAVIRKLRQNNVNS
jgi:hypothetical protein